MAFSVSPSVIVREVDASQTVPGAATAPAALAGIFKWGPVNDPILITSENDLVDRFGKPTDDNYETFFTASDFLAYSNALYVVRADDASVTASGTTIDDDPELSVYAAFDAKYPGALGNSIEVSWATASGFETPIATVGDINANAISNTAVNQTIVFNSSAVSFEVANTVTLPTVDAGDVMVIGNPSIGYQELVVLASVVTDVEETFGTGNTAVTATIAFNQALTFTSRYTLAETDLSKLSFEKKWSYNSTFGVAPKAGHLHVAVIDKDGGITGTPGNILEAFDNLSTTAGSTNAQGATNYYPTVIENSSSWIQLANSAVIGTGSQTVNAYETMSAGTDGSTETTATLASLAFAYDTFKNANEIDISLVLQGKGDDNANANYIVSNVVLLQKRLCSIPITI